jgi:Tfp pilus assembly protein PilN
VRQLNATLDRAGRDTIQQAREYRALVAERDELRAEARGARMDSRRHYENALIWKGRAVAAETRQEAAEAKLARIEALAPEFDRMRDYLRNRKASGNIKVRSMDAREANTWDVAASKVRAALADAPTEQRAEGGA